jgi:hypothetical protein
LESFWNFSWRPRPPSMLPSEKEKAIVKTLKAYAKRFEEEDELLLAEVRPSFEMRLFACSPQGMQWMRFNEAAKYGGVRSVQNSERRPGAMGCACVLSGTTRS